MNVQDQCIVWIHGIGETVQGYSAPWKEALDPYLKLPDGNYTEVLWSDVFGENKQLNAEETLVGDAIHTILAGLPGFTQDLDAYVGEFVPYLVKPDMRTKVNAKLSQALLALPNNCNHISLIAHSWGTVVAYETLQGLAKDQPQFRLTNLFTLGSPLKYVQLFLGDNPGPKPWNTTTWVNIYAQGDLIASSLRRSDLIDSLLDLGFQVDRDSEVPNFGGGDAHASYFVQGNVAVLQDIIASTISNS
ncbi:MAG TPA: hypothetical protein VFZ02_06070 [Ktedonobacteraceae bacterium]